MTNFVRFTTTLVITRKEVISLLPFRENALLSILKSGVEVDELGLIQLAEYALSGLRIHPQAELSILLVDEATIVIFPISLVEDVDIVGIARDRPYYGPQRDSGRAVEQCRYALCTSMTRRVIFVNNMQVIHLHTDGPRPLVRGVVEHAVHRVRGIGERFLQVDIHRSRH